MRYVLYHSPCTDGLYAAAAAFRKFGAAGTTYLGTNYGTPEESYPSFAGHEVYLLDFSFKRAQMQRLLKTAGTVVVIDHHASAEKELAGLASPSARLIFDKSHSAATLAWQYFFPKEPVPQLYRFVEDRDLWTKQYETTDAVAMALRVHNPTLDTALDWIGKEAELARSGELLLKFVQQNVEFAARGATLVDTRWGKAALLGASSMHSEIGEAMLTRHPEANFAMMVWPVTRGLNLQFRSRKDGTDVSEIARKFGGGGHQAAAGANNIPIDELSLAGIVGQLINTLEPAGE